MKRTVAQWWAEFEELQKQYNSARPRDAEGRPVRGDVWDDFMWRMLHLQYELLLGLVGVGRGESIDALVTRLVNTVSEHSNEPEFLRAYFRREIEWHAEQAAAEAREA